MRLLLACLLALVFATNPMVGSAMPSDCAQMTVQAANTPGAMAGMDMPAKADTVKGSLETPCPGCGQHLKDCIKMCASMAAVSLGALPWGYQFPILASTRIRTSMDVAALASFEPARLDPPPRTTA